MVTVVVFEKLLNKDKQMTKNGLTLLVLLFAFKVSAQVLPVDGPERKQLIAMGYDITMEDEKSTYTVASNGSAKIVLARNSSRLVISRFFNRKKLSPAEEFELLKVVNSMNVEFAYQMSLEEGTLNVSLYHFGAHDPRAFAALVRLIEQVKSAFDSQPELLKLTGN